MIQTIFKISISKNRQQKTCLYKMKLNSENNIPVLTAMNELTWV